MKKYICITLLSCISIFAFSQNAEQEWKKNRFLVGFNVHHSFGEELTFGDPPSASIYYARYFNQNEGVHFIMSTYSDRKRFADCCEVGDLTKREAVIFGAAYMRSFDLTKKLNLVTHLGLSYRLGREFRYTGDFNSFFEQVNYDDLGINPGFRLEYNVMRSIILSFSTDFHHYLIDFNDKPQNIYESSSSLFFHGVSWGWQF